MSEWKEYKLGELCDFQAGTAFPSDYQGEISGDYPFIKVSDMNLPGNERIIWYANNWITEKACRKLRAKIHPKDATVFAKIGVALTYNRRRLLKQPTIIDNNMMSAIACNNVIPLFLYYLLCTLDFNDIASGTALPYININDLKKIHVKIPPLPEQRAIASVLSSLDDKIDLLHRENKTLEAMAETLFRQWFIEEADEDWKEGTISDIIDILSGFPFRSDTFVESGKYRLITIKSVQDGYLELSNTDMISDIPPEMPKYCYLKQGDILLTLTGNVGRCCLVDSDDLLLNQRVAKLKPKNNRDIAYTYVFFRMEKTKRLLEEMAKGTAQPNLSPVETAQMEILIPSSDKLEFFSDVANPLIQKLLNNRIQIHTLEKLRDTLLPKLMSGEVRIQY